MQELKFLKLDGEYAILEAEDGNMFRVLAEDFVRSSKKPASAVGSKASPTLSPREIQLEIRSGMGVAEIATKAGVAIEYVEKFAAPVLDELAHVVQSALSTRISIAGDRYSETIQVEFGEVIASRLAAIGVTAPVWSSRKVDNNAWQVSCSFSNSLAVWAFDPKKLSLSPENEAAVSLSAQQTITDGPIPKLRPVATSLDPVRTDPPAAFTAPPTHAPADIAAPPAPLSNVVPLVASTQSANFSNNGEKTTDEVKDAIELDPDSTKEFEGVIPFGRQALAANELISDSASDLANTADLLDALRKRRQEREAETSAQHPFEDTSAKQSELSTDTAVIPVVAPVPDVVADNLGETQPIAPGETASPATEDVPATLPAKKGRTSVPKWDEIVFGSSKSDED